MLEVEVTNEISDLNLAYVLLAQKLLRHERPAAMLRLGISRETADFLLSLSVLQMLKLATTNFAICSLRGADLMEAVVKPGRETTIQQAHLSIVLAGQSKQARTGVAA